MKTWELDVVQVTMDDVERASAAYAGALIHEESRRRGLKDKLMSRRINGMFAQQVGTLAERVVAKELDLYWSGAANTFKHTPDLSHNIEVRCVRQPSFGLRVVPSDPDDRRVVCVLVEEGKERGPYHILGWCYADEGKQRAWLKSPDRQPYYIVPQHELRPFEELRELVRLEIAEGVK